MTKVLIIRFSSIGDIVLTTPVIRNLKKQMYNGVEIHYITKKKFTGIIEPNPYISKVYSIEKSTNEVLPELLKEGYDYIIDLHHNLRSSILKKKLKVLNFSFDKLNWEKWLLVNFGINKMPKKHIVDRYMETILRFEIENDNKGLDFFIDIEDEVDIQSLPENFHKGYISLVIGAAHWRKKLPVNRLIELCKRINSPIILLGGPEDEGSGKEIEDAVGRGVFNTAGKFRLGQSASLIKQSSLVITHDTGLMHIAAAFKKKIISVWAATVPEFGMYPYLPGEGSEIVQADHLKKRPCSKLGTKCKYKPCKCVEEIDLKKITSSIA